MAVPEKRVKIARNRARHTLCVSVGQRARRSAATDDGSGYNSDGQKSDGFRADGRSGGMLLRRGSAGVRLAIGGVDGCCGAS